MIWAIPDLRTRDAAHIASSRVELPTQIGSYSARRYTAVRYVECAVWTDRDRGWLGETTEHSRARPGLVLRADVARDVSVRSHADQDPRSEERRVGQECKYQ